MKQDNLLGDSHPSRMAELCPECGEEVEIAPLMQMQTCPSCRMPLAPCALCDPDTANCSSCPLDATDGATAKTKGALAQ